MKAKTEQELEAFEAWMYLDQIEYDPDDLNKREVELARLAYQAGRATLQSQPMLPEISRDLLGKIVDEVFDGAIEDASAIEDIYRVIARECALQSQGQEDAQKEINQLRRALKDCQTVAIMRGDTFLADCIDNTGKRYQSAFLARLLDHARRIEGADDA